MIMIKDEFRVAVVGAGISGLNCAARLMSLGYPVEVFDRGRGPGGRASRRREAGWRFQHGAPGGYDLMRRLAAGLTIHSRELVVGLRPQARGGWRLEFERGSSSEAFDVVVLALPPEQAVELLTAAPGLARVMSTVRMDPCLVAMVGLASPVEMPDLETTSATGSLERAVRQQDEQPRVDHEAWVLYGETQFSRDNLECDLDLVAQHLVDDFTAAIGGWLPPVLHLRGHRWRYARVRRPLGMDCLYDPLLGLGVCGDWCRGMGVDEALASGRALAARIANARPQQLGAQWWSAGSAHRG
jgi:predicted NAD/FAD-dependent oxidoreductase